MHDRAQVFQQKVFLWEHLHIHPWGPHSSQDMGFGSGWGKEHVVPPTLNSALSLAAVTSGRRETMPAGPVSSQTQDVDISCKTMKSTRAPPETGPDVRILQTQTSKNQ